ncbi:uncharacterized protein B0P05DRAFT_549333 [Gilbertella persicaria]|uniref:uncharacterized protein n=1 Tax=Gilbertella persicaria TaxID=101096 RepID=UPI00221EEE4A|nr:uncharacterized protein B0P05DRAFT_549333 [Gilbertella persicaria]KAI8072205.1 hypothetical protein B0P05DRAFT_549333 [Gilbertella persicaria]
MSFSRSPPQSPSSHDDWLSRGPHSAKTYSSGSSRHASRTQSFGSASSRAQSIGNIEATAKIYYAELKAYLKELLAQEAIEGPHPQRVAARQKLTRLSNLQFHELAMDVYDEVVRRNKNDKFLPFLPVKEEFHPKRNQARQKLATLPVPRFQDLASDVYSELTRRFSSLVESDPPVPQMPGKSTNIIPVKGTISVENLDRFSGDESTMAYHKKSSSKTPISPSESKDYFSRSSNTEVEKIKSDYEYQINIMTNRIKELQHQVDQHNSNKSSRELESLKMKEQDDQRMLNQIQDQYQSLKEKYDKLNQEYSQQQEAVREVKRETKQIKKENVIQELRKEIKDWHMKYDKARIELRSMKAASVIESGYSQNIIKENYLQPTRDGVIAQDAILTYQAHIDDLLFSARSRDPSQVIHIMKNIVSVCRSITEEIESKETKLSPNTKHSLYELKTRFSTSLSDLLVSAKYHANGMGISPVSLLDRSASHLTAVIVDLAKLLGMHDTPTIEGRSSPPPLPLMRANSGPKRDTDSIGFNSPFLSNKQQENGQTPAALAKYLKTETDLIVQTIQNLLAALRLPQQNGEAHMIITELVKIVTTIIELAKATCKTSLGYPYRSACDPILDQLFSCSRRIGVIQQQYFGRGASATAIAKRDLARESYEIAKFTKELIALFEDESK